MSGRRPSRTDACCRPVAEPPVCLALHAEDSSVATERTQLALHGSAHCLDRIGARDQRQSEAQWNFRDTRDCHQRIAQRVMRLGGLIACLQQCPAHFLPGAKKCERLVDPGELARAAAVKIDDNESALFFDEA